MENPGQVLGTIHFARFPESSEEKVTDATGDFKEDFEHMDVGPRDRGMVGTGCSQCPCSAQVGAHGPWPSS